MCRFVFLFLLCFSQQLVAQIGEADIASRLIGRPLYLRCLCAEDKLTFDAEGKATDSSSKSSFTVSGIEVEGLRLEKHRLVLGGRRIGLDLSQATPERVALQQRGRWSSHDERMYLVIASPTDGNYQKALDAVFTEEIADLAPGMSSAWRTFAREHFGAEVGGLGDAATQKGAAAEDEVELHAADPSVLPPHLIHSTELKFSNEAKESRRAGMGVIGVRVNRAGIPVGAQIIRAIGFGLDENAVEAVEQYRFQPAMRDGTPLTVRLNIEVHFRIF